MAALLRATARRSTRPLLSSAPSRTLAYAAPVATDEANIKVEFDVPLNDREAPPVDRMNVGQNLMNQFGLV